MAPPLIVVDERAKENGFAAMLSDLLRQNLEQRPAKMRFFNRLKGAVAITAPDAEVKLTLCFNRGSCIIYDGVVGRPEVHIVADAEVILGLSNVSLVAGLPNFFNGSGRDLFGKILAGKLKIHGMLLHPLLVTCLTNIFSVN